MIQSDFKKITFEVHDVTVTYQYKPVLWGIDFQLPEAQRIAIVGPNGAGKSTLLKAMMGLLPLSSGTVALYGSPIKQKRSIVAYVPQRSEVDWNFPITVSEVVMMGRRGRLPFYRRESALDREYADRALEQVGMIDFKERQISQLSGGQQQRVFIARALAQDASIYVLDEPFAGVDAATERAIADLFIALQNDGKTVVAVHHDLHTIGDYFSWCLMLNLRLIAVGSVEQVFTAENLQKTYGGRLGLLTEVAERLRKQEWRQRAE